MKDMAIVFVVSSEQGQTTLTFVNLHRTSVKVNSWNDFTFISTDCEVDSYLFSYSPRHRHYPRRQTRLVTTPAMKMTSRWMGMAWSFPDWVWTQRKDRSSELSHLHCYFPPSERISVVTLACTPVKRTMMSANVGSWQAESMACILDSFRQQTHFCHNPNECPF